MSTILAFCVMATLGLLSVRLHIHTRRRDSAYNADYTAWQAMCAKVGAGDITAITAGIKAEVRGPLGELLLFKLGQCPQSEGLDQATLEAATQTALSQRAPQDDLDQMARFALILIVGNILGALATSPFVNHVMVFILGVVGILLNLGALGRVDRLRGLATRAAIIVGGAFLNDALAKRDS